MELGFQIIAVSPEPVDRLKAAVEKNALSYRLVSDPAMEAARAFGLAYLVSDETAASLARSGVQLVRIPDESRPLLPVPAVFIVRTDGEIAFSYANPNYKVRLHPDLLLAAARTENH